jgi:succinoglycan biosynthesis transport protein ExoP
MHLLKRWAWTLLLAAWVAGLVGYVTASLIPPTYEARTRLLVGPVNTDVNTVRAAESLSLTYAELATGESQLRRVIERLGLDIETADLTESVGVVANGTTRILSVQVAYTDPETTAAIANAVSEELITLTRTQVRRPEGELSFVDRAEVPSTSTGTNASLIAFLAAMAGLIIAGTLVAALEYLGHTVKTRQDLAAATGTAVLGEINVAHGYVGTPQQPLVVEAEPDSKTALGYRMLATRIPFGDPDADDRVRSLLVVGSQSGERSGELAANLAAVIARTGRSVTLIDTDDLEAQVTTMFVPEGRAGLSELLALTPEALAEPDALDVARIRRVPDMWIIPAGNADMTSVPEDAAERLLEAVSGQSDVVVMSGSSIDRSATALTWARLVDAVVIVARADFTRVENLTTAVDGLRLVEAKLLGAVLLERQRGARLRRVRRKVQPEPASDLLQAKPLGAPTAWGRGPTAPPTTGTGPERHTVGDKSAR